jgi:stage V sporulation protein S
MDEDNILRVRAGSNPQNVASSIAHAIYDSKPVKLRAVGAGAVNQAIKAVAIARGYVAPRGINLSVIPGFQTVTGEEGEISAIVLSIVVTS